MTETKKPRGRYITNKVLLDYIESGKLDNLFTYLSNNRDKYNLTVRDNKFTLYSFGRSLDIKPYNSHLSISYNMNNADLLLKYDKPKLDEIIKTLKEKFGFDTSKYDDWVPKRLEYISKEKDDRSLYKAENDGKTPEYQVKLIIKENEVENYDFAKLLHTLSPVFESYSDERPEEKWRQECMGYYHTFAKDLVVYDVEYKPNYENADVEKKEKELCQPNGAGIKQFFKSDLLAIKKVGEKYIPFFIELKVNCGASIGEKTNIGDHIVDWQNYCAFYKRSEYERKNFKYAVLYTLRFMVNNKLLDCDNIEKVISKIDFEEPPHILVACGLISESPMKLIKGLRKLVNQKFESIWQTCDTEIIIGKDDPKILLEKGTPINELIQKETEYFNMNKEQLKNKIMETANIMYLEDMSAKVEKRLEKEFESLEKENTLDILTITHALTSKIEKMEFPVIYDGFMADSLIAYLLGLSEIDPTEYSFKEVKEKTARIFVPVELRETIIDYARTLYETGLKITKINGYKENLTGIEEIYHLEFDFTNVPIDLVVTKFPYQTIVHTHEEYLEEEQGYTFDNKIVLDYLQRKYELPEKKSIIRELLKKEIVEMPEIHSQKTKVSIIYKLALLEILHTKDYYKTLIKYSIRNYADTDHFLGNIKYHNANLTDTLEKTYYDMYGDGFEIIHDSEDKIYLTCEDYKEEIDTVCLHDLYPYDFEETEKD